MVEVSSNSVADLRFRAALRVAVHNVWVPFTLAHVAAARPLRRLRVIPSALVVGTIAPDFEYFLRLAPDDGFGHTLPGIFVLTVPLALLVLWVFHRFVKLPLIALLPVDPTQVAVQTNDFRFGDTRRFCSIVGAVLLGIATHVTWDSFTHLTTWLYHHWSFLRRQLDVPFAGLLPCFKVLQHGSTVIGIAALLAWTLLWCRTAAPFSELRFASISAARKMTVVALVTTVSFLGAMARAIAKVRVPTDNVGPRSSSG